MTLAEARMIRHIKKRATYRGLAEIYYPKSHPGHGNQGYGDELCFEAFKILYPKLKRHPFQFRYGKQAKKFDEENRSCIGDFYWWE